MQSIPQRSSLQSVSNSNVTMRDFIRTRVRTSALQSGMRPAPGGWFVPGNANARALLYVSDIPNLSALGAPGTVNVYAAGTPSQPLSLVGQITGLDSPTRVAVDRERRVYVVQTDFGAPVLVFDRGSTHPFRALATDGELATSIALGRDDTVFVGTTSTILVYAHGSSVPTSRLDGDFGDGINDLLADRAGNVYFDYVIIDTGGIIGMFAHGASPPDANLGFPDSPLNAALLHDGDMVVAPLSASTIDRFERGSTVVASSFPVAFMQSFGVNRDETALYGAGAGTITTYAFPSGTPLRVLTLGTTDANFGVASSPPQRPARAF